MKKSRKQNVVVACMALLMVFLLAGILHAEMTTYVFTDVDMSDADQSLPRFTYTTASPPGAAAKLRIIPCDTTAFSSYIDLANPLYNQYDYIQCYVDVIDANGNIVNKDNTGTVVTVTLNEIGGSVASSAKFSNIFTSPRDYTIDDGRGAEFGISDTEAEQVEIHATAGSLTDADPVTLTFAAPGTITGSVTIPSGTDTDLIYVYAYAQDVGVRDRLMYIFIMPGQLTYDYAVSLLEPGTYKIGFEAHANFLVADPVKVVPLCENNTPLQETVAAGETKSVAPYTLVTCTSGGVEGDVSISGRANLNGTMTTVFAMDESGALCNSTLDIYDSLNNYSGTDGNHYELTCLDPGVYKIIAIAQELSGSPLKYWWKDAGTVTIPASGMVTRDIVLSEEYAIGIYETILYNSPVEYDAVAALNPNLQWTNDLTKDPNVPAGLDLAGTLYDLLVIDRCGNVMWAQDRIPHSGGATQTIAYGDTSKGAINEAPQTLDQLQVFDWSVSGSKFMSGYDFSTGAAGWTYHAVSPPFNMPNSSTAGAKLSITATDNTLNFGYWQSPTTAIQLTADTLYRVRMQLSTDVGTQSQVPQVRMRVNSSDFQQADYQIVDSQGGGEYSPTSTPQSYYLYFAPQKSDAGTVADFESMAFDLLNFNPGDASNGTVSLNEVEVNVCAENALTGQTSVGTWDFSGGAGTWQFATSVPFTQPTSGASGGALTITATDNTSNFGYWFNNSYFSSQDSRLYRARFTVRSNLADRSTVPQLRMRFLTENYQCGRIMEILSSGSGDLSPNTSAHDYNVYFYPPQSMTGGNGIGVAFDLLNFDPLDSSSATIYLDNVAVDNFDIPTMY
jgi:hypothetical protein